jgi:hypothetical protein
MQESEMLRLELESKKRVLKQLEGVYKTSRSLFQRRRVLQEIENVKNLIKNLNGKLLICCSEEDEENAVLENPVLENAVLENFVFQGFSPQGSSLPRAAQRGYSLLSFIPVFRYREDSRDREIDAVVSYVDFFEKNYLPLLSDYYIKLDFSHSIKRDTFYPRHMEIKKVLKEYDYELDVLNREEFNSIAHYRDKSVIHKVRHRYLLLLDRYIKDLRDFLETLVDDLRTGGNIILNPQDQVNLSEFQDNRRLDGLSISEILEEMRTFSDEFTRFLSLPDI